MANLSPSDQATSQHEIPDSEEDSPIHTHLLDERDSPPRRSTASPSQPATVPASSSANNMASRAATDVPERRSYVSPRTLEPQRKISQLRSTIEDTEAQLRDVLAKLSALPSFQRQDSSAAPPTRSLASLNAVVDLPSDQRHTIAQAQKTLDHHIKQLGEYNQLKDIAMGMLGLIAEKEGKTLREIMDARDIEDDG